MRIFQLFKQIFTNEGIVPNGGGGLNHRGEWLDRIRLHGSSKTGSDNTHLFMHTPNLNGCCSGEHMYLFASIVIICIASIYL
jgi:hypothetical protein